MAWLWQINSVSALGLMLFIWRKIHKPCYLGLGTVIASALVVPVRLINAIGAILYCKIQRFRETSHKKRFKGPLLLGMSKYFLQVKWYIIATYPFHHRERSGALGRPLWILHIVNIALTFIRWLGKWPVLSKARARKDSVISGLVTWANWSCRLYNDTNKSCR